GIKRKFRTEWSAGRAWLHYDPLRRVLLCSLCEKARVDNIFVRGCSVLKKENIVKHEKAKGDNSHQSAKIIVEAQHNLAEARAVVQEKNKEAAIGALKMVYFLA